MSHSRPLPVSALARTCPPASLGFRTTAELPDIDTIVGQDRAMEAIDLAVGMVGPGFNVFALGPSGIGKMTALRRALTRQAARDPIPDDWCYVHDFAEPQRPRALRLPAGQAVTLRSAMRQLCTEVQVALVAAFESDTYRARRDAMETDAESKRDATLAGLEARGRLAGVAVVRTPVGLAVAPLKDGKPLEPDAFHALPEDEQQRLRTEMERLGAEVQEFLHQLPIWTRELSRHIRELDREVTTAAVRHLTDELRARFIGQPDVIAYLDAVEADVVERAPELLAFAVAADGGGTGAPDGADGRASMAALAAANGGQLPDPFRRYRVNVLVDRDGITGAPFVVEDHPTVANLVGRVEHAAQLGTLVTDFTLIRAGALHRANGGYLVLEAEKLLTQPYAWAALKRALVGQEIRIESVGPDPGPAHRGRAGAATHPVAREGRADRGPAPLLPAVRPRPGVPGAVQGPGRLHRGGRPDTRLDRRLRRADGDAGAPRRAPTPGRRRGRPGGGAALTHGVRPGPPVDRHGPAHRPAAGGRPHRGRRRPCGGRRQ